MTAACPFCAPPDAARVLAADAHTHVILSNPRLMPGHLLVVPHRHVVAAWELTEPEVLAMWRQVAAFEQKLLAAGLGAGCDIRQNYRPFLPDSRVKQSHLHIHIQPRQLEDELYSRSQRYETGLFQDLTMEEQEEITRRLA